MMTKKYLFLTMVLAVLAVGCFEDREILFEENQIEWEPPNPANNELNLTVELEADQTEDETVTLRMRYAGEHQSEALTGVFEIDSEDGLEAGTHYSVSSNEVTVPANSSFSDEIEVEVVASAFSNGDSYDLILTITDASDVKPMANYKDFVLTIEKGE